MCTIIYDNEHKSVYKYLKDNKHITCNYETFSENVEVHKTANSVYIHLFMDMSNDMKDGLLGTLLNVEMKDLIGYDNSMDWFVQKHELVRYIPSLMVYIVFNDNVIVYEDL